MVGILQRDRRLAYLAAVVLPVLVTFACMPWSSNDGIWPALATLYLVVLVFIAVWIGLPPALLSLVESALLLDYFFVGPVDNLSIPNRADVEIFVAFVLLGIVVALSIGWRRANERRLEVALALVTTQAELTQVRAAADLTDLSIVTGQLVEQTDVMARSQAAAAARIEELAAMLMAGGPEDARVEVATELLATAGRLRMPIESRS